MKRPNWQATSNHAESSADAIARLTYAGVLSDLERLAKISSTEAALELSIAAEHIKRARDAGGER